MKKILVQFTIPGMTTQQYEQCWEEMRNSGHANPTGLLHHVSAQQGNNMIAVDVWESEETFNNFSQVLMPIFVKAGVTPVQPVVTPVLFEYSGAVTV